MNTLTTYSYSDIDIGMTASFGKTVTEADILAFSDISGDTNPLHLNAQYAATTMFAGRVAPGMLSASFISTVFGARLPGPGCVYVSQSLRFRRPVRIGDTVVAVVECASKDDAKKFCVFKTRCLVGETVVIDGEATIMVPARDG